MTDTEIYSDGISIEYDHDFDTREQREVCKEYCPYLTVTHRLACLGYVERYTVEYEDLDQSLEMREEDLRALAKIYADAVAAIDAHMAKAAPRTMEATR